MCGSLPFITATADGPKHIDMTLTRAKFEDLCSDLLDRYVIVFTFDSNEDFGSWTDICVCRLKTPVQTALNDAKLSIKEIDEVILVGGSTRIPAVQDLVRKMIGKEPNVTVNPDEVVALGAAVQVSETEKSNQIVEFRSSIYQFRVGFDMLSHTNAQL